MDKKTSLNSEVFFRLFSCHATESQRLEGVAETQFFGIGEEILYVTRNNFILCRFPEFDVQQIAVVLEKSRANLGRSKQKSGKFLGENIVSAD